MKSPKGNGVNQKGDDYPVEQVSWFDVQEFIHELNSKSGRIYRLPDDAEWEYACRANSPNKYCGGDDLNSVAWYGGNSKASTHPVGGKKKNSFGLYDMNGNVSEWSDDWHFKKYATDSETDSGVLRMLRGGSYEDNDNGLDLPTPKTRYSASFSLSGRGNTLLAFSPVIRYKEGSRFPLPKRTRRHP